MDGTLPHDRVGEIFASLDAEQFQRCFMAWVAAVTGLPAGVIAIGGKTVRRSGGKKDGRAPIYMVSAFAARQRLVLGQVKVAEKSNEIIAIPKVLRMIFRDDEWCMRTDHAPANFTKIKHMAHNFLRIADGRDSMRLRRKVAARDDDSLVSLITR